jgi:hypothetical protein
MSQGSSLIGALIAKAAMLSDIISLQKTVEGGSLDNATLERIATAVRALPTGGVDWSAAVRFEAAATVFGFQEFAQSNNQTALYRAFFDEPMPASLPPLTAAHIQQYEALMQKAADALRLEHAAAPELAALLQQIRAIHPVIGRAMPSLTRMQESRMELAAARQRLLDAVAAER